MMPTFAYARDYMPIGECFHLPRKAQREEINHGQCILQRINYRLERLLMLNDPF
jgi:hypothetical protein